MPKKPIKRTPQSSISRSKKTKSRNSVDEVLYWSRKEQSKLVVEKRAERIIEAVLNKNNFLTMTDLYLKVNINKTHIKDYCNISKKFADAVAFAKICIGNKRERLAMLRKIDNKTMFQMQGIYDPEWKEQEQYHAALKAKANAESANSIEDFQNAMKHVLKGLNQVKLKE